jgi:hypothetical protein
MLQKYGVNAKFPNFSEVIFSKRRTLSARYNLLPINALKLTTDCLREEKVRRKTASDCLLFL